MGPHNLVVSTRTQRLARPGPCLVPQAPPAVCGLIPDAIVAFQMASRRAAGLAAVETEHRAERQEVFAGEEPTVKELRAFGGERTPEAAPEAVLVAAPEAPEEVPAPRVLRTPTAPAPRSSLDDLEDWFTGEI